MNWGWSRAAAVASFFTIMLAGCLEIEQHPPYINGEYDGKPDDKRDEAYFNRSGLAWFAVVHNRNQMQNEYNRTGRVLKPLSPLTTDAPGGRREAVAVGGGSESLVDAGSSIAKDAGSSIAKDTGSESGKDGGQKRRAQ